LNESARYDSFPTHKHFFMKFYSKEEIHEIVEQFKNKSLPKERWTHEAHIIVAMWHNLNFEFKTAYQMMKSGIITYNEAVGTANTDSSGYHETLTRFWMLNVRHFMEKYGSREIDEICNDFLRSEFATKAFPMKFYSREHLFSVEARTNFVPSDLKPIDFK